MTPKSQLFTKKEGSVSKTRRSCSKCGIKRTYLNPIDHCDECGHDFCFDHLYSGQFKKGMLQGDLLRDVCEDCKVRVGYI